MNNNALRLVIGTVICIFLVRLLLPPMPSSWLIYRNINWSFIGDSGLAGAVFALFFSKIIEVVVYASLIFGLYFWTDRKNIKFARIAAVFGIICLGVVVDGIVDHLRKQNEVENFVIGMNEPFIDAGKFHPRVTFLSYESIKDPSTSQIDGLKVKVLITSSWEGEVKVVGGLYESIQDKDTMNTPRVSESKIVSLGEGPTEVNFYLTRSDPARKSRFAEYVTMNFEKMNTFGIYMTYMPKAEDYGASAQLSYNPIDDVDDSGDSNNVISDPDNRTVFYDLGSWSN